MSDAETHWTTKDLYAAAALQIVGFRPTDVHRNNDDGRAVFVFAADDRLALAVADYRAYQLAVDARSLGNAIRGVKAVLYTIPTPQTTGGAE